MSRAVFLREYKIAVVGDAGVGKSTLTIQFFQNKFVEVWDPTIENSYQKQTIVEDEVISMDVLDPADLPYNFSYRPYLRTHEGFLIVYSITSEGSFDSIPWLYKCILTSKNAHQWPVVLVGNKCDMEYERKVAASDGRNMSQHLKCPFMECSAKLRLNVDEAFIRLIQNIKTFNGAQKRFADNSATYDDPSKEVSEEDVSNDSPGCYGGCVVL